MLFLKPEAFTRISETAIKLQKKHNPLTKSYNTPLTKLCMKETLE